MNFVNRRLTLAIVLAGVVPAFGLTHLVVGEYKAQRLRLANEWSARGRHDLPSRPAAAAVELQTALSYGPERAADRLDLARALTAARRPAEAQAELLALWTDTPGDGEVNLELARASAMSGDVAAAVRYYHAAIDGAWESGAPSARRQARLELARMLLAGGQRLAAQSELVPLTDDLPADAATATEVTGLFAAVGATAFKAGDYRSARTFLASAAARDSLDAGGREMLAIADRVLALDAEQRSAGPR